MPHLQSDLISEQETVDLDPVYLRHRGARRNPCYLLSGLCMLAGCFLVSRAAHLEADAVGPVFAALGVLVLYEVIVIGLAVLLVRQIGRPREASHLLLIEALLLADVPLIYNELFLAEPIGGGIVAALGLGLGLVKFGIVSHSLGIRPRPATWALLSAALALVFGIPGLVRLVAPGGFVPIGLTYALWWCIGMLIAAAGLPVKWESQAHHGREAADARSTNGEESTRNGREWFGARWRKMVLGLAIGSAAGHLLAVHWAFNAALDPSHISPVLLGIAAVIAFRVRRGQAGGQHAGVAGGLIAIAVFLSLLSPPWVIDSVSPIGWVTLSPMRWTLLAGSAVAALLAWRSRGLFWAACAPALWLPALLGPTLGRAVAQLSDLIQRGLRVGEAVLPRTGTHWGFLLIAGAFVLLVCGALWSGLRRGSRKRIGTAII